MARRRRGKGSKGKGKTPMTMEAAARIQSHSDRTGTNAGFKQRAQSTADGAGNPGGKASKS